MFVSRSSRSCTGHELCKPSKQTVNWCFAEWNRSKQERLRGRKIKNLQIYLVKLRFLCALVDMASSIDQMNVLFTFCLLKSPSRVVWFPRCSLSTFRSGLSFGMHFGELRTPNPIEAHFAFRFWYTVLCTKKMNCTENK
jgi:hypothetical protein